MTASTLHDNDPLTGARRPPAYGPSSLVTGEHGHAVSWPAIFAGATAAAALSLILLVLGVGLGLSSMSPWASHGAISTTAGVGSIAWILFVALAASGMGGYLAGRLRSRWAETHVDEVYFRDTAHGFLAWAVATLLTAGLLTSTIGAIVGTGVEAGASAAGAVGTAATSMAPSAGNMIAGQSKSGSGSSMSYFTDTLFRPMAGTPAASNASSAASSSANGEGAASSAGTPADVGTIFVRGLSSGSLSAEDIRYVAQLISQRTGMNPADAEKRVADTFGKAQQAARDAETKAKETADKARKAGAYASLWLFVSLLLGAFVASLAATFGGRRRDL